MIYDLPKATKAFCDLFEQRASDQRCIEMASKVFDWRMRALDETGEISVEESEQLSTNCDRFLTEAGQYLKTKGVLHQDKIRI